MTEPPNDTSATYFLEARILKANIEEEEVNRKAKERERQARDREITQKAIEVVEEYGICDNDYASQPPFEESYPRYMVQKHISKYDYEDSQILITKSTLHKIIWIFYTSVLRGNFASPRFPAKYVDGYANRWFCHIQATVGRTTIQF